MLSAPVPRRLECQARVAQSMQTVSRNECIDDGDTTTDRHSEEKEEEKICENRTPVSAGTLDSLHEDLEM